MMRTQIQLTPEQYAKVKRLAEERRVSMAALVRGAVEAMVSGASVSSDEERRQRAKSAAGRFASGLKDVSERHDDYLADAFAEVRSADPNAR